MTRKGPAWDRESPWSGHVSVSACGWEDSGALSGCPQLGVGLSLQEGGWLSLSGLSTETSLVGRRAQRPASPTPVSWSLASACCLSLFAPSPYAH